MQIMHNMEGPHENEFRLFLNTKMNVTIILEWKK